MVSNIPCRFLTEHILLILNKSGFTDKFDFVYAPVNPSGTYNKGYFFVNFVHPEHAAAFRQRFHHQKFGCSKTEKACKVSEAALQGDQIKKHFRSSLVKKLVQCPWFASSANVS